MGNSGGYNSLDSIFFIFYKNPDIKVTKSKNDFATKSNVLINLSDGVKLLYFKLIDLSC